MTLQSVYPGLKAELTYQGLQKSMPFKDFCKQAIWEKLETEKKQVVKNDLENSKE